MDTTIGLRGQSKIKVGLSNLMRRYFKMEKRGRGDSSGGEGPPSSCEALGGSSVLKKKESRDGRTHSPALWSSITIISYVNRVSYM